MSEDVKSGKRKAHEAKLANARKERAGHEAARLAQLESLKREQSRATLSRLSYLMGQSEIFQHFLTRAAEESQAAKRPKKSSKSPKAGAGTEPASPRPAGAGDGEGLSSPRRQRGASSTEEEDAALLQGTECTRLSSQPSNIKFGTMRDYQLEGLNWMISLHENGLSGILADEMGLGKTLQTISLLAWQAEGLKLTGPHLVLVPKSTLSNWMAEFARWCPSLRTIRFHGTKEERAAIAAGPLRDMQLEDTREFDVVVTTYEVAIIDKNALGKIAWQYLVIDEAHRIKNESSKLSVVVRQFAVAHRLLLTGTPLQNNLHELWALLNFLLPDVFGSSAAFDEYFDMHTADDKAKTHMIQQLHRILRPFMLRRLKVDVATSIPPKKETILEIGLTKCQKKLYKSILSRDFDAVVGTGDRLRLQNILMQLRKVCAHPYLFEGVEDRSLDPMGDHLIDNCAKLRLLDKLLPKLKERGSRVLIFSQMTRLLDILEDYLRIRHYDYCRIDGSSTYEAREDSIDAFNAPASKKFVFLLSTRAGGLGINLATADTVILYDSDWNPQVDLQAQDRAHRIGQKKPVNVFRLVTAGTVEEKILERAKIKLKLDAVVVQQGRLADKSKALSKEDMLEMIQHGAASVFRTGDHEDDTDDVDIDAILAAGEKKTKELQAQVEALGTEEESLLNFKLDTGSTQVFEGVDYSDKAQREKELESLRKLEIVNQMSDALGRRERRVVSSYNENEFFGRMLKGTGLARTAPAASETRTPKRLRLPRMDAWHLYNIKAMTEVVEQERAIWESCVKAMENSLVADVEGVLLSALPEELKARREALMAEGFPGWARRDFQAFVRGCATFGRFALERVAGTVGKDVADVIAYAKAFWTVGPERLPTWDKVLATISKGEAKLREARALEDALAATIVRYPDDPWNKLEVGASRSRSRLTKEHDQFLLCQVQELGYGRWEELRCQVLACERFKFDYAFRTMSTADLRRRAETLMRGVEKELVDSYHKEADAKVAAAAAAKAKADKSASKADLVDKERRKLEKQLAAMRQRAERAAALADKVGQDPSTLVLKNGKFVTIGDSGAEVDVDTLLGKAAKKRSAAGAGSGGDPSASKKRARDPSASKPGIPDCLMPVLARAMDAAGTTGTAKSIKEEFLGKYPFVTKAGLSRALADVGVREKREGDDKARWHLLEAGQKYVKAKVNKAAIAKLQDGAGEATEKQGPSVPTPLQVPLVVLLADAGTKGKKAIVAEFMEQYPFVSKASVNRSIDHFAAKEKRGDDRAPKWYVKAEHAALVGASVDKKAVAALFKAAGVESRPAKKQTKLAFAAKADS